MCWKSIGSGPLQTYRIVDSDNNVLYRRQSDALSDSTIYAVNVTTRLTSKKSYTIQALSSETVPSAPLSFTVSG